jgi:deoxyadenosine/deoxycytidine kinase
MHISVEGNIAAGKTTFLSKSNERILARGLNFIWSPLKFGRILME